MSQVHLLLPDEKVSKLEEKKRNAKPLNRLFSYRLKKYPRKAKDTRKGCIAI